MIPVIPCSGTAARPRGGRVRRRIPYCGQSRRRRAGAHRVGSRSRQASASSTSGWAARVAGSTRRRPAALPGQPGPGSSAPGPARAAPPGCPQSGSRRSGLSAFLTASHLSTISSTVAGNGVLQGAVRPEDVRIAADHLGGEARGRRRRSRRCRAPRRAGRAAPPGAAHPPARLSAPLRSAPVSIVSATS